MTAPQSPPLRIAPSRHGGHWKAGDWISLDLNSEEGWKKAIDILEDRIEYRFFRPVEAIQHLEGAGFSIMALDCLLIETIVQFMEGTIDTPNTQSGAYFRYFLTKTSFSDYFDDSLARIFYEDVRCGILHQAETKGDTRLLRGKKYTKLAEPSPQKRGIYIQRDLFHRKLTEEFRAFIERLRNSDLTSEMRIKIKRKMDAICGVYQPIQQSGILAFGSLIDEPGSEIGSQITERYMCFKTPFDIEYARSSTSRDGAPTLTKVDHQVWAKRVFARVLALNPSIGEAVTQDMLYRREIDHVGDMSKTYAAKPAKSPVEIKKLKNFGDNLPIFYACLNPNLPIILNQNISLEDKAKHLAECAIRSVTKDTFQSQRDGIRYLDNAFQNGIITALTPLYYKAILDTLGATNLEEARQIAAKQNGVI